MDKNINNIFLKLTVDVSGPHCTIVSVKSTSALSIVREPQVNQAIFTACDKEITLAIESARKLK